MIAACFDEQLSCVLCQEPLRADVWGGGFTMPSSVPR